MEITDKIVLREADTTTMDNALPKRAQVRACSEIAYWRNIAIEQCEDEGNLFVGLSCYQSSTETNAGDIAIQIRIEDVPVLIQAMQQAYEKQVIKEHQTKWRNNND
tara:strand:+ start:980 stop:1297 length:318 start_codon:yes stop_codon:yes gene_type:complete